MLIISIVTFDTTTIAMIPKPYTYYSSLFFSTSTMCGPGTLGLVYTTLRHRDPQSRHQLVVGSNSYQGFRGLGVQGLVVEEFTGFGSRSLGFRAYGLGRALGV